MKNHNGYEEHLCRYFEIPGEVNTTATLEAARRRASQLGVEKIILPSYTGKSALAALRLFAPQQIILVRTAFGFEKPNAQGMKESVRRKLEEAGVAMVTGTHALGGVGRSVRRKLGTYQIDEIIAYTLRIFGQGTKVAVEAAVMAADAGAVRTDEDVIAAGGSSSGLDTALVLRPVNASSLLDMKIREIICKPSDF